VSKVLIIDDDKELSELFQDYLSQEGFEVEARYDGTEGLDAALTLDLDLVILDIMLPDISGINVLQKIRAISKVPVLMFTAKGDDIDRIIGLESGADDYVPKPCTPRELVARVRAILRRTHSHNPQEDIQSLSCGPLEISSESRKAIWFEQQLELTSTEFNLLFMLAAKAGLVVSKDDLSRTALGKPLARYDRSIDVHISSIRQKLAAVEGGEGFIQTIRGQGYQFVKM
jgi:DNA-binding response OmpR family regulator